MFGLEKVALVHFDITNLNFAHFHQFLGYGVKLSVVSTCPWCQIVRGVILSVASNCPFLHMVSSCPGFKFSGVKLSAVSNFPTEKERKRHSFSISIIISSSENLQKCIFAKYF